MTADPDTIRHLGAGTQAPSPADPARREALSTFGPRVMKLSGAFAGLFRLDYDEKIFQRNYRNPVLVASQSAAGSGDGRTDLALRLDRPRDLAVDIVASSVNDLLTIGAEPLFLLHHLAGDALPPQRHLQVIEGLAEGCRQAGCALLSVNGAQAGGPQAKAPLAAAAGQVGFDLSAFVVGVCDHRKLITGTGIEPGDDVIGIAGAGVGREGFALAAGAAFERAQLAPDSPVEALGCTIGEELLRPERIYAAPVLRVLRYYRRKRIVLGMAHVAGGGLPGSIERVLPADCQVQLEAKAWSRPAIFDLLQQWGVDPGRMWQTMNMGIGFVLLVRPAFTASIIKQLRRRKMPAFRIGGVSRGPRGVEIV